LEALALFHQIVSETPHAKPGKLFGAVCFKAPNGKAVAFFHRNHMVFKLDGEMKKEALSLDGTSLFTSGGRPMGAWVQVPYDYCHLWRSFASSAMEFVNHLPANKQRKKA